MAWPSLWIYAWPIEDSGTARQDTPRAGRQVFLERISQCSPAHGHRSARSARGSGGRVHLHEEATLTWNQRRGAPLQARELSASNASNRLAGNWLRPKLGASTSMMSVWRSKTRFMLTIGAS